MNSVGIRVFIFSMRAVLSHSVGCAVRWLHHRRRLLLLHARCNIGVRFVARLELALAPSLCRFRGTSTGGSLSASRCRVLSPRTIPGQSCSAQRFVEGLLNVLDHSFVHSPHHGDLERLNFHLMSSLVRCSCLFSLSSLQWLWRPTRYPNWWDAV